MYIREAHAAGSHQPVGGNDDLPPIADHETLAERKQVAEVCMTKLELEPIPALVDDIGDSVNEAYGAWPDRLYLIGADGRVAYRGDPGPLGFDPGQLEDAIVDLLQ